MRQSGDPNRYLGLGPEPSWRRLQVSIPAGEQSHDLGDVQLGHDDANLTVTVLSPEGNPVPRARLQFERKVRMHRNGEEKWYDFAGDLGQGVVTSDTGRFVLVSFDSRYAFMSIFGLDNEHASVLDECRVKVGQSSYQRGTYEFSAQDRELTVTLEKAYPLSGQVQIPANLGRLQLEVRPTNSLGKGGTFVQSLHFSRGKQQADGSFIVPFQIKQLANTPYSLEFSTGESESKYFRLESTNPAETPELAEVIDLRPHIDWLELAIVDTEGRPLGQADQSTYQFFLREFHTSGGSHGTDVTWQNDFIVVPKPQGERFNGAIQVKGFRSMPLGELAAGRHTLKLAGMREVRFRYALDRQLPFGTRIHTDWFWLTGLDDPVERDASADPNADVIMRMGIGGTFMLTWEWLDANGNRMNSKRERYTVKESELGSGEVIELKVPDGLFE